jgi:hypothetical protein
MRKEDDKCYISSTLYTPSIIKFEIFGAIQDTRDTYPKRIFLNILYIPSNGYKVAKAMFF